MRLRAILDVRISPDGERVAYVVSTPSLPKNEHEAELFVIPSGGGQPRRVGETVRIFNVPVPRPQLRWSPDGMMLSVLGFADPGRRCSQSPLPEAIEELDRGARGRVRVRMVARR
jgi:tricorn protease-like protein